MRYLKNIFHALFISILAISCIEELDAPQTSDIKDLTLVPHVTSFANQYVTKAYDPSETKITRLAVLVFNKAGKLAYIQEAFDASGITSIVLNKSMLNTARDGATLVMFANIGIDKIKNSDGKSLKDFKDKNEIVEFSALNGFTCHFPDANTIITDLNNFDGFPMMGTKEVETLAPTTTQQTAISVDLKILYAKVKFDISVAADGNNQTPGNPKTGEVMSFKLNSYTICNVSKATKLAIPTGATASNDYAYSSIGKTEGKNVSTTVGGTHISFTFYMAESRFTPSSNLAGVYPTNIGDNYKQQYKPKVANLAGGTPNITEGEEGSQTTTNLATYVLLDGQYTDYRSVVWDVKYKVYLGKDNHSNFEVDRNSAYENYITIKGVRNNNEWDNGTVWLDHRVQVDLPSNSTSQADHITITRETLIDSHFEVRPLRVNLPSTIDRVFLYLPKYIDNQINETQTGSNENWIAIENNNGRIKDFTIYSENGKRKYFTAGLIKELYLDNTDIKKNDIDNDPRKGQKYLQLVDGDCAWIYIDENTSENKRDAKIELVFYDSNGNIIQTETIYIEQKGLYKVSDNLYIETFEEYLHSYDSQDLYTDPTKDYTEQGHKWGLDGVTLSNSQNVVAVYPTPSETYYYDYFHAQDKVNVQTLLRDEYYVVGATDSDLSEHTGLHFTNKVAGPPQNMSIIDMSTKPLSAIQYCLSKNKFRVDDSTQENHTMDIHWYLPDAYEMSAILNSANDTFTDFKNNLYWTSQPSWKTSIGAYLYEDSGNARAVSLSALTSDETYQGTNTQRDQRHRIRCAYSPNGIPNVDFSGDRAPEGIGAMHFYMRAWKDWNTQEPGYFGESKIVDHKRWLLSTRSEDSKTGEYNKLADDFAFPKESTDADSYTGAWVDGYGFSKDPIEVAETYTESVNNYASYVAANKWPGLTEKKVVSRTYRGATYYVLEGKKEESESEITTFITEYTGDIMAETSLRPLDHLYNGKDLTISFTKGEKSSKSPKYEYYQEDSTHTYTKSRVWELPEYKTKTKQIDTPYSLRSKGGVIGMSSPDQEAYDKAEDRTIFGFGYKKSRESNNDGYIYPTSEDAITAGYAATEGVDASGEIVSIPTGAIRKVTAEETSSDILVCTYYTYSGLKANKTEVKRKCYRYRIEYTVPGQTYYYYQYDKGGQWKSDESNSTAEAKTPPSKDQFIMYGGNSITIKAENTCKISSVKIHFSGSNKVFDEGGRLTSRYYLRFTKDGYTGSTPPGMKYSDNGASGTMTWSGEATSEVTLKLVVHKIDPSVTNIWGEGSEEYVESASRTLVYDSYDESIIIDQIDVRYK